MSRSPVAHLLFVLLILSAKPLHAQGADAFAGEWRSRNSSNTIVGANVYKDATRWVVQLLGACAPTPCVWDAEPLVVLDAAERAGGPPRGMATVQQSNMRRVMTFRLEEESMLVEVYSMQLPVPGRGIAGRNYYTVDELTRMKPIATPQPSTRPK
jgi:hypothetical protein